MRWKNEFKDKKKRTWENISRDLSRTDSLESSEICQVQASLSKITKANTMSKILSFVRQFGFFLNFALFADMYFHEKLTRNSQCSN